MPFSSSNIMSIWAIKNLMHSKILYITEDICILKIKSISVKIHTSFHTSRAFLFYWLNLYPISDPPPPPTPLCWSLINHEYISRLYLFFISHPNRNHHSRLHSQAFERIVNIVKYDGIRPLCSTQIDPHYNKIAPLRTIWQKSADRLQLER